MEVSVEEELRVESWMLAVVNLLNLSQHTDHVITSTTGVASSGSSDKYFVDCHHAFPTSNLTCCLTETQPDSIRKREV